MFETYKFTTKHSAVPPQPKNGRTFYQEFSIAGLSYYLEPCEALWRELHEGTEMALVRNHNNSFDKNAVAVTMAKNYDGNPATFNFKNILGYIPASENTEIAKLLDGGFAHMFAAEVTEIKRYGNFTERINVTIWIRSKEEQEQLLQRQPQPEPEPRSSALRIHSLGFKECVAMIEEIENSGFATFEWPTVNHENHDEIMDGDKVVILRRQNEKAALWLMRVINTPAKDSEARSRDAQNRATDTTETALFKLSNIAGPLVCDLDDISFMDVDTLGKRSATERSTEEESAALQELFTNFMRQWQTGLSAAPSQITTAQALNWINPPQCKFFYRDTPAPINLADYKPKSVFQADFRVDLSEKFYCPEFATRFLVCTCHAKVQSNYYKQIENEPNATKWELATLDAGSTFMVIDIYSARKENKEYTQILLVQIPNKLPEKHHAQLCYTLMQAKGPSPYIEKLVASARKDFDNKLKAPVWDRQKDWQLIERMIRPLKSE